MEYPTRNHLPVHPSEIDLPESRLNLGKNKNWHNHHAFYYSGAYKRNLIHNSLRDLEGNQFMIPKDVHVLGKLALHNVYTDGVPLPPLKVAMERLEQGHEEGERFKVWSKREHGYLHHEFTDEIWEHLQECYNAIDKFDSGKVIDLAAD